VCWKPRSSCRSFHLLQEEFLSAHLHSPPLSGSPYRSFSESPVFLPLAWVVQNQMETLEGGGGWLRNCAQHGSRAGNGQSPKPGATLPLTRCHRSKAATLGSVTAAPAGGRWRWLEPDEQAQGRAAGRVMQSGAATCHLHATQRPMPLPLGGRLLWPNEQWRNVGGTVAGQFCSKRVITYSVLVTGESDSLQ
jgi:hypothetical protein